jgi:hypothetical protein
MNPNKSKFHHNQEYINLFQLIFLLVNFVSTSELNW